MRVRTQAVLEADNWYRAAVTFDNSTALIYLNGVRMATVAVGAPLQWNAPELRFGAGVFGALRIWTSVRTPAEIASNLNTVPPPQPALLACYGFEEQAGGTVSDSSSHGNDAVLTGSWQWENEPVTRPHLNWVRSGHNLILSWPANSGFVLESTDTLRPAHWTEVTDLVEVVNGQNRVNADTSSGSRFFRLAAA